MTKTKGFSLSEVLIALVVLGTIITLTITNGKKLFPDIEKSRFKKAYNIIEKTTSTLLNDEVTYPDDKGFANTTPIETEYGDTFGVPEENTKFRDAFKFEVNIVQDNINCPIWGTAKTPACFKTDDGVVYGIPDTDFVEENIVTVKIERTNDQINAIFVPITIYPNWSDEIETQNDMDKKALFIGVRANGQIKILEHNVKCKPESQEIQCKAKEFIKSTTLRKTR